MQCITQLAIRPAFLDVVSRSNDGFCNQTDNYQHNVLELLKPFWCLDTSKICWTEGLLLLTLEQVQLSKNRSHVFGKFKWVSLLVAWGNK